MLKEKNVAATIAVKDLTAARRFYEDKLKLHQTETDGDHYVVYKAGTGTLLVYQSEFAGGYKATVATFAVGDDIEEIVDILRTHDIKFEHYPDMPGTEIKGDIHIMGDMKNAWFKDPDGNIICLVNA